MGLHLLDFRCFRAGDGVRFIDHQVSEGSLHHRGARWLLGHVPNFGAAAGCMALLCSDVRLRRLRTRNRRLDVEFPERVSRF